MKKLALIVLIFGLCAVPLTNASFSDQKQIEGSEVSAGWWVVPEVEVLTPNGGETYMVGDDVLIVWTAKASDPSSDLNIKIYLSQDGGASYSLLVDGLTNTNNYIWNVNTKSSTMRIKVEVTDDHGLVGHDESDEDFDPEDKKEIEQGLPVTENKAGDEESEESQTDNSHIEEKSEESTEIGPEEENDKSPDVQNEASSLLVIEEQEIEDEDIASQEVEDGKPSATDQEQKDTLAQENKPTTEAEERDKEEIEQKQPDKLPRAEENENSEDIKVKDDENNNNTEDAEKSENEKSSNSNDKNEEVTNE